MESEGRCKLSRTSYRPHNVDELGNIMPGRTPGLQRHCEVCDRDFWMYGRTQTTEVNRGRFCSRLCKDEYQRGQVPAFKQTTKPPGTKQERIAANGLVNMRIRRGADVKPDRCVKCDRGDCRIDGHHPDYTQPDLVAWLCRSCHMRAHRNAAFEIEVAELARQVQRSKAVA